MCILFFFLGFEHLGRTIWTTPLQMRLLTLFSTEIIHFASFQDQMTPIRRDQTTLNNCLFVSRTQRGKHVLMWCMIFRFRLYFSPSNWQVIPRVCSTRPGWTRSSLEPKLMPRIIWPMWSLRGHLAATRRFFSSLRPTIEVFGTTLLICLILLTWMPTTISCPTSWWFQLECCSLLCFGSSRNR